MVIEANFSLRSSHGHLDFDKATLVTKFLASSRSFSKSFDAYLSQVLMSVLKKKANDLFLITCRISNAECDRSGNAA